MHNYSARCAWKEWNFLLLLFLFLVWVRSYPVLLDSSSFEKSFCTTLPWRRGAPMNRDIKPRIMWRPVLRFEMCLLTLWDLKALALKPRPLIHLWANRPMRSESMIRAERILHTTCWNYFQTVIDTVRLRHDAVNFRWRTRFLFKTFQGLSWQLIVRQKWIDLQIILMSH